MLNAGTKLGPYEITGALGAGGMGEVYRARDTRLGRDVAIKILPQHLTEKPDARQRFEREARAISSLNHPHICTLYDVGHQDGADFLVMELLEGETLAKRLDKGPLTTAEVLRIGIEVADALDKAHRKGILHRDLKPSNIMLAKSGAKLMDFGLAKEAERGAAPTLESLTQSLNPSARTTPVTAQGTIVGTFQYMSPEQMEGKEADARSDIFSLGAMLYEMATGKRAFEGKTTASVIAAILEREPPAISTVQPMSPPALDRTVKICLAKDPDERFQSAHDVKLQLQWIREAGSQAGVPAPVVAHRKIREHIAWAVTVLLVIVAIALAYGFIAHAPQPAPSIVARILPPTGQDFALAGNSAGPPTLSPDGHLLAFAGLDKEGKQLIWVQRLNSMVPQSLAGTEGGSFPFWSPDSRELAFFANGSLNRMDASGGPILQVCSVGDARGGTWSKDGMIIFSPGTNNGLEQVAAAGGVPQPLTTLDSARQETSHRWPQLLPDQEHFLYYAVSNNSAHSGTYVSDLRSRKQPILLEQSDSNAVYAPPGFLLFVRQNMLMGQHFDVSQLKTIGDAAPLAEHVGVDPTIWRGMFTVSESGLLAYEGGEGFESGSQLLWFDRTGKQLAETGTPSSPAGYANPAISPDGRKLAVGIPPSTYSSQDIWIFDLSRGTKTRLTFNSAFNREPAWSPDGKSIVFISNPSGEWHVYMKAADGTGDETPILADNVNEFMPAFTPDARYLVLERGRSEQVHRAGIWALPLFGDRKPIPVAQGQIDYVRPSLSPDGKWVAYESAESGQSQIYVVPFPQGKGKWQVSINGGHWPRWNPAGKELFYISPDYKLMVANVTEHGTSLDVGSLHELFQSSPAYVATSFYDVSPDGKKFVFVSRTPQSLNPLTLVVNWPALLKKQ